MTVGTVLPAFFALGIAFIPLGIALLLTSDSVQEFALDYTTQCTPNDPSLGYADCAAFLENSTNVGKKCHCHHVFELTTDFKGRVYMYYGLTNFYQNHRRYVKSRDDAQLGGANIQSASDLGDDCQPYKAYINGSEKTSVMIPYAPCGSIANSLFNDTLKLTFLGANKGKNKTVPLNNRGIAWETDKNVKFSNPDSFNGAIPPPNWQKSVMELDPNDTDNNGYKNEDLIVWMRTAALPTFRKLYRRVEHLSGTDFEEGLPKGHYQLDVAYNYPVTQFEGTKRMYLTTTSWMGGKNPFLGIAYLVVGSICIVLGIVFLIIHIRIGKKPMDMMRDLNSRTEY